MESGEDIAVYTVEEIKARIARGEDMTDWERVRSMTDEEIEAGYDPDEEGYVDWDTPTVRRHDSGPPIELWIDEETVAWFRSQGEAWPEYMAQVLREHAQAKTREGAPEVAEWSEPARRGEAA